MKIENAKYFQEESINVSISCIIDGKTCSVPININNRHYAEIMRQVAAGTLTIADAD